MFSIWFGMSLHGINIEISTKLKILQVSKFNVNNNFDLDFIKIAIPQTDPIRTDLSLSNHDG